MKPTAIPAALQHVRLLWLQWLLLTSLLLSLVWWGSQAGQFERSNAWLNDLAMRLHSRSAHHQVVLVLADDRSIASIGRWPWRRALHAQVLQHIEKGQPQSIGLDFLFSEPDQDYPADDALLAQTLAASRRVVLPVTQDPSQPSQAQQPIAQLAQAAAALAHSHLPLDRDGSVRHFHPWESDGTRWWPHLSTAMLCIEHPQQALCQPPNIAPSHARSIERPFSSDWRHWSHPSIRFAQAQPGFTRYAYIDVLQGRIPPSAFRNKHIVIAASATGVSPNLATPSAPQQVNMTSALLLGHILHSNLNPPAIYPAPTWVTPSLNLSLVLLAMLALWLLGPSAALLFSLGLGLLVLLLTLLAPLWGWHLQPVAGLIGLASSYPLWSWRRQSAALGFLRSEIHALQAKGVTPASTQTAKQRRTSDFLEQHIQAVEQALARLHELQAQREQSMRFISHDIRAPISAIITSIELEQHMGSPKDAPPLLERINHSAHNALQLADDFVHLARSLEQPSRQRATLELGLLIDQVLDDHWAAAQARRIQLDWLPQEEEALVWGDTNQLRRSLGNLLSNAIKYGPSDSRVSIHLSRQPHTWRIAISDQGEGIAPEELPQLFAPFARQKRHEAGSTSGVGLGLAYTQTVIHQHQGRIWADNLDSGGAVFYVELPVLAPNSPKAPAAS